MPLNWKENYWAKPEPKKHKRYLIIVDGCGSKVIGETDSKEEAKDIVLELVGKFEEEYNCNLEVQTYRGPLYEGCGVGYEDTKTGKFASWIPGGYWEYS